MLNLQSSGVMFKILCLFVVTCGQFILIASTVGFIYVKFISVIEFWTLKNNQPKKYALMGNVYGIDAFSYTATAFKRWAAEFCWGRTGLQDDPMSRCMAKIANKGNCRAAKNIVQQNCLQ